MKVNPYLVFDGTCEEALLFYERALGSQVVSLFRFEGSPMADHVPAGWGGKILHGLFSIDGQVVMASDAPPGRYQTPQGMSLSLGPTTVEDAERIFEALADGGQVTMPLQQTFWATRFGMVTDRFGIPWMVNCDQAT